MHVVRAWPVGLPATLLLVCSQRCPLIWTVSTRFLSRRVGLACHTSCPIQRRSAKLDAARDRRPNLRVLWVAAG